MKLNIFGSVFFIYRPNSNSNEPTLKNGRILFSSKLKKPALKRFLVYRATTPETGLTIFIHRICGLPGDLVEIRNGTLYVNRIDVDKNLTLKHVYRLTATEAVTATSNPADAYTIPQYPDTVYVSLTDSAIRQNEWNFPRHILPPGLRDNNIYSVFKQNWNPDNFGPLRVPPGKYFVLGDNREQSMDSRHYGFVDASKFLGCVLFH